MKFKKFIIPITLSVFMSITPLAHAITFQDLNNEAIESQSNLNGEEVEVYVATFDADGNMVSETTYTGDDAFEILEQDDVPSNQTSTEKLTITPFNSGTLIKSRHSFNRYTNYVGSAQRVSAVYDKAYGGTLSVSQSATITGSISFGSTFTFIKNVLNANYGIVIGTSSTTATGATYTMGPHKYNWIVFSPLMITAHGSTTETTYSSYPYPGYKTNTYNWSYDFPQIRNGCADGYFNVMSSSVRPF